MNAIALAAVQRIKALPGGARREVNVTQCVPPVPALAARTAGTGCVTLRARKRNSLAAHIFSR